MLEGIGENFGLWGNPCEDPWRQNILFHYARSVGLLAMQARTKMQGGTVSGLAGGTAAC